MGRVSKIDTGIPILQHSIIPIGKRSEAKYSPLSFSAQRPIYATIRAAWTCRLDIDALLREDNMDLYYSDGKQKIGPISKAQLQDLIRAKKVNASTLVWRPGMDGWQELRRFARTKSATPSVPAQPRNAQPQEALSRKFCVECGQPFAASDMISFKDKWVCAGCKPTFVQKIKEGVSISADLPYAGFWIRFGAYIIDYIILTAVYYIISLPFSFLTPTPTQEEFSILAIIFPFLALLIYMGVVAVYNIYLVGKYSATPGKLATGLNIVMSDGGKISYGRATGRFFAKAVSWMTLYIGFIIAAFDGEKRSLHDRICDTRVIRVK